MKKHKKITALMMSVLMVFASAGAMSVATFAWFTRGTEAAASGFDFTASAASGIQISTDPLDSTSWKSSITTSDFDTTTPGATQENNRLSIPSMEPVSTIDDATGGSYTFYSGTYSNGDYTLAADTSNYLVFDLYFLNQGATDLTLSLTDAATVLDGATDQDTSLATRVGFVVEGSDNDPATAIALNGAVSSYIWEPNSLDRSASALANGANNSAKYYYNGISNDNSSNPVSTVDAYKGLVSGSYTSLVNTTKDPAIGDDPSIATLPGAVGGQITKIKVFVWIEGQDVDCQNDISSGDVDINLAFDSGDSTTQLGNKTADSITGTAPTQVALTGTGDAGAEYNAYVFQELTDTTVTLDYRLYLATGTATHSGTDVTSIDLDTDVSTAGTYQVVVTATLSGSIGSRTSTNLSI